MENEFEQQEALENPETEDVDYDELDRDAAVERLKKEAEARKEEEKSRKEYEAKMKHWRDKAQKLEERFSQEDDPQPKSSQTEDDSGLERRLSNLETEKRKREFGYQHGLSPEETDDVFRFAGNEDPKKALEHPFVKAGIEARRIQKRVEQATPSSGGNATTIKGKTYAEMTAEERAANYKTIIDKKLGKA